MNDTTPPTDYASLALAGVVQAALLVHRTANGEPVDVDAQQALLASISTHRAGSFADVFPEPQAYRLGARVAVEALSGRAAAPEVLRYSLQLIDLAKMLKGIPQVVEKLGRLLDGVDRDALQVAQLASIYQQTISTLGKRIQVTGNPQILQRDESADRIRALLLAGVRMAWLWQQLGGRRWHLILRRRPLLVALQPLAQPAPPESSS
jgi:high frequency lysogenization protein